MTEEIKETVVAEAAPKQKPDAKKADPKKAKDDSNNGDLPF